MSRRPAPSVGTAVGLACAGVLLSACGGVHPGAAVSVAGESLSVRDADRAATAYCAIALANAQQQGVTTVNAADSRRQAVADFATWVVARDVAEREGLTLNPKDYEVTPAQRTQIRQVFADRPLGPILEAIERSQYTYRVVLGLGEQETGQQLDESNEQDLSTAGQKVLQADLAKADATFDPRFGASASSSAADTPQSGSLSVAAATDDAEPLPADQTCR